MNTVLQNLKVPASSIWISLLESGPNSRELYILVLETFRFCCLLVWSGQQRNTPKQKIMTSYQVTFNMFRLISVTVDWQVLDDLAGSSLCFLNFSSTQKSLTLGQSKQAQAVHIR